MCNVHKHHRVCMVGLCTMEHHVLVHFVVGGFGLADLPRHCWEGLVVDRLPAVGYWLGSGAFFSSLPLLIFGGRLVGTVLLCEHLSQRSGWSSGGGLNCLHWWCIVDLSGRQCHK